MAQDLPKDVQDKITELQILQQRATVLNSQRIQLQMQQAEAENALAEIDKAKPPVYKIVGEIMIEQKPDELKKELKDRLEELDIRIKSFDKQEEVIKKKADELQRFIAGKLK